MYKEAFLWGLFVLKIGLSIQALRLNIANSFLQRAVNKDEITREVLILVYFDDVSHFDLLPSLLFELEDIGLSWLIFADIAHFNFPIVFFIVLPMPLNILVDIFDHGEAHDKGQRHHKVGHSS
jgi:hypothetical protein